MKSKRYVTSEKAKRLMKALDYYEITEILLELLCSHAELASAEYKRNPRFNNTHPAYVAEEKAIKILEKHFGIPISELMEYDENQP